MAKTKIYGLLRLTVCVLAVSLVLGGLAGCKGKKTEAPDPNGATDGTPAGSDVGSASTDPLATAGDLFREPAVNVDHIVDAAKTWQPLFRQWWGKIAPADFTLTDIDGIPHKLSDYRGKNVVVVIWRTSNATCKLEVPQLKDLRGAYQDKDLAILTISNEDPELLKAFAAEQGINFTVLSSTGNLPAPFGEVQYAPGSFFLDPQGRFKLAARGFVSAEDAKTIVQAK
jgi:peroxiredoxin